MSGKLLAHDRYFLCVVGTEIAVVATVPPSASSGGLGQSGFSKALLPKQLCQQPELMELQGHISPF